MPAEMGDQPSSPKWYVIRTHSQAEGAAASQLARDGFEVFLPRVKSVRARTGGGEAPLFPGYLFLQCNPEGAGRLDFRSGHRVAGWVNFGGVIPAVPEEVITELKLRVDRINRDGGLWRRFRTGEKVNVVSGNVETLAEVVSEAKSPEGRVKVLLNFMGRMVEAQVPSHSLWPAESASAATARRLPRRTRGRGRWIHAL